MNYRRIYKELYEKAKNRTETDFAGEIHHFIPRCIWKHNLFKIKIEIENMLNIEVENMNNEINLYKLTYREHILSHIFLMKIFPKCKPLAFAVHRTFQNGAISSRKYSTIKENISRTFRVRFSGKNNGMFGKSQSDLCKNTVAEKNRSRVWPESCLKKLSDNISGEKHHLALRINIYDA
jgi:hypothetical protein